MKESGAYRRGSRGNRIAASEGVRDTGMPSPRDGGLEQLDAAVGEPQVVELVEIAESAEVQGVVVIGQYSDGADGRSESIELFSAPQSYRADRHPARVYLARLAPGSRASVRGTLQIVAELLSSGRCSWETLPWHRLEPQHTKALRAALAERYAPSSANKMISIVRGVLREAWELGHMNAEQYQRAASMRAVRGERSLRGRALSQGELRALFSVCDADPTPAGARDAALLAILYGSGLRRSEAVALDVAHYNKEDNSLQVVAGKGNKDRICYTASGESEMIEAWLRVRGEGPGPLFCHIAKGGKIKPRRLTDKAVLYIAARRGKMAGLAHFSPHDLRRSMISDLLEGGADLSVVQRLAGHSQVTTTARYDRRGEASKRRAAKLLHIPAPTPRKAE